LILSQRKFYEFYGSSSIGKKVLLHHNDSKPRTGWMIKEIKGSSDNDLTFVIKDVGTAYCTNLPSFYSIEIEETGLDKSIDDIINEVYNI